MPVANAASGTESVKPATRSSPQKKAHSVALDSKTALMGRVKRSEQCAEMADESELECAACPGPGQPAQVPGKGAASDRETWICCSHCKTWFHCLCINVENPDDFSKWYCKGCIRRSEKEFASGTSSSRGPFVNVVRPPRRKSNRAKLQVDYAAIQEGMPADPVGRWQRFLDLYHFILVKRSGMK